MRVLLPAAWLASALALAMAATAPPAAAGEVRIWRCTDGAGRTTLRDAPCRKGETTVEVRGMQRPKDPAPRPRPANAAPAATAIEPTRVLVVVPPAPMYECIDPDGRRYTSETGDGNPRWVPMWTLGYPGNPGERRLVPGATRARRPPPMHAGVSIPRTPPLPSPIPPPIRPPHGHPLPWPVTSGGGQWIADHCVQLPPGEACALLMDRRNAIRTRFFNAQERERNALRIEERGINARLANDCGGA